MEHLYTADTKTIDGKIYYFVKKIMTLPEFEGLAEIVVGYGMHTDFEKACKIAGVMDVATKQQLLQLLEEQNKPKIKMDKHEVEIPELITRWLAKQGTEVLN